MSLKFTKYAYASNNTPSYIHNSSYSLRPKMIVRDLKFSDIKAR
jgi:hypothetical protein